MLFHIDEFPERLHHPKETELPLFPRVAAAAPEVGMAIARPGPRDHEYTEKAVRDIQHLLGLGAAERVAPGSASSTPSTATSTCTWSTCA